MLFLLCCSDGVDDGARCVAMMFGNVDGGVFFFNNDAGGDIPQC